MYIISCNLSLINVHQVTKKNRYRFDIYIEKIIGIGIGLIFFHKNRYRYRPGYKLENRLISVSVRIG